MTKRKGGKGLLGGIKYITGLTSRVLMLACASLLCLSYLSIFISPAKFWLLSIFGLLFIPLALVNLFLLVWAIYRRSTAVIIPFVALIPSVFFIGQFVQFSSSAAPNPEDGKAIKVISYNVGRFRACRGKKLNHTACLDSIACFINRQDADVVCLQEFYVGRKVNLKALLKKKFPGYTSVYYTYLGKNGSCGNVTLSRLPVKDKGFLEFTGSTNLAIYSDILVGDRKLRIYNCHLQSYNISPIKVIRDGGKDSELLKETEEKMRSSILRRPRQVVQILSSIEDSPVETLVCGDFNDTPLSYTYHKLCKGHKDSFVEAGKGFGSSYYFLWPLLRIDYILYSTDYEALSHRTAHLRYSDHYPVIARINPSTEKSF